MTYHIIVEPTSTPKSLPEYHELQFGSHISDHMFMVNYTSQTGWHNPRVIPYQKIALEPTALVFHYAQSIFEGLKIFRRKDGHIGLFRPQKNAQRLNASAAKMAMPELPEDLFLDGLKKLVEIDSRWVPDRKGFSLYARPVMIATEPALGVRAAEQYLFYIILTPVPSYYNPDLPGYKLTASRKRSRSALADVSDAKTAGNYGKTLRSLEQEQESGYNNILWLGGEACKFIEEAGITNVFVRYGNTLATPPLNGRILPGITRESVITLLRDQGFEVLEREIEINELTRAIENDQVQEVFLTGTATVVAPVDTIEFEDRKYKLPELKSSTAAWLFDTITSLQNGSTSDPYGWTETLEFEA
ncbi:branched-chain amino acid aminotransferase [Marinobacter sp. F3R11]|uniref:branched-chain amino acid aminotransferase n=1 Tax=Marinobacter sp. F3R11 TaxID=2267231 RepID=UPI000DE8C7AD|nr:branched-chain amino acid aminotransferase [Marinobacter sp. F3R11]RBW52410.1 branched-chain amino acid aminotransferase [Marinobacter sp. F3R11]